MIALADIVLDEEVDFVRFEGPPDRLIMVVSFKDKSIGVYKQRQGYGGAMLWEMSDSPSNSSGDVAARDSL